MNRLQQLVWPLLLIGVSFCSFGVYGRLAVPSWALKHLTFDYLFRSGFLVLVLIGLIWAVCVVHPKRKDAFKMKR